MIDPTAYNNCSVVMAKLTSANPKSSSKLHNNMFVVMLLQSILLKWIKLESEHEYGIENESVPECAVILITSLFNNL